MPFVLVADFAGLALWGVMLVLAVAAQALFNIIGGALGFFGFSLPWIGKIGVDIGGWIAGLGGTIANWLVEQTKGAWHVIENWISGHSYALYHLAEQTVTAIGHVGGQIAHIVNTSIPQAISYAVGQAETFTRGQISSVEHDVSAAAGAAASALTAADRAIYQTIASGESTIANDLKSGLASAVTAAEHFASVGLADLRSYVDQAVAAAEQTAASDLHDVKVALGSAIAGTAALAQNELASAEGVLGGEISTVATEGAQALSSAVGTLTGEIQSTASGAAAAIAGVAGTLGGEIASDVGKLTGEISTGIGTLTGELGAQAQAFTGDLSNLQSVLTAAMAAGLSAVLSRVSELEKCSVGVCESSPNNFKSLLNDALGLTELAGLGVFLTDVIQHPAAAEHQYASVIQGTFTAGRTALDDLLAL